MSINKKLLATLVATLMTTTAIAASVGANNPPTAPSPATVSTINQTNNQSGEGVDKAESSDACEIKTGWDETRAALLTIESNMPKRTDIMKKLQENESTKGCLASTKEILDLAATLPTIKGSWGSIGSIIRNRTEQEIKNLKNKAIDRACAVADQAIADVMAPIKENVRRINDFSELVSNAPDAIAGKGSDYIGGLGAKTAAVLDAEMNRAQNKVNSETSRIVNSLTQGTSVLDEAAFELGFENIGDAAQYGNNIQVSNALAVLQNLQAKIPAKPQYTASRSGDGYVRCVSGSCQSIDMAEYSRIQKQWSDYNAAMNEYGPQIEMANTLYQDALKNSSGRSGTTSYSTSNSGLATSTTKLTESVNNLANQGRDANVNITTPSTNSANRSTATTSSSASSSNVTQSNGSYASSTQSTTQAPKAPNPFGR